jgi:hypothetical protein
VNEIVGDLFEFHMHKNTEKYFSSTAKIEKEKPHKNENLLLLPSICCKHATPIYETRTKYVSLDLNLFVLVKIELRM